MATNNRRFDLTLEVCFKSYIIIYPSQEGYYESWRIWSCGSNFLILDKTRVVTRPRMLILMRPTSVQRDMCEFLCVQSLRLIQLYLRQEISHFLFLKGFNISKRAHKPNKLTSSSHAYQKWINIHHHLSLNQLKIRITWEWDMQQLLVMNIFPRRTT